MHYAENECAMPIWLHCNELRALCLTTNALCRTAEIGALLLKCVLIVYIWPEKGVVVVSDILVSRTDKCNSLSRQNTLVEITYMYQASRKNGYYCFRS